MSDAGLDPSTRAKDKNRIAQWRGRGKVQGSADTGEQVRSMPPDRGAGLWTTPLACCAFARSGFVTHCRDPLLGMRYQRTLLWGAPAIALWHAVSGLAVKPLCSTWSVGVLPGGRASGPGVDRLTAVEASIGTKRWPGTTRQLRRVV